MTKIGIGYDVHRLRPGRRLFLGGIEIPFRLGLVGHSDGDGLIHALIDALLGAAGEGDIGQLFPDHDPKYRNIRSTVLLEKVVARLREKGLETVNADCVVVAEEPKLAAHIEEMKAALCPILGIRADALGIKGKTSEGTGLVGEKKAIACWAVALVGKKKGAGKKAKK
jgi:2-C-methyl-D-erythritol 2,4-cyclodiphosphate synthase